MNILYAFYKSGFEADYWEREISAASDENFRFTCFNYASYLSPWKYARAQLLDNLYYAKDPALMRLYRDFEVMLQKNAIDAVIVDTMPAFHPDYLRRLPVYKILRIGDGPISAYDRDFAYLHAYDKVLYHSPAYSEDMNMEEKLHYCGATNVDFWPMTLFDQMFDTSKTAETILGHSRDIEIIFIGSLHVQKMAFIAKIKKALGSRLKMYGMANLKKNVYYNLRYGFPGWVRPVAFENYVPLYQRTRIGINIHNRGKYTIGSYRLFDLPGNGVMQLSDGGEYLDSFFREGEEIIGYENADDLIDKIRYYLANDSEREKIALNGYLRVMRDHHIKQRMRQLGELVQEDMK